MKLSYGIIGNIFLFSCLLGGCGGGGGGSSTPAAPPPTPTYTISGDLSGLSGSTLSLSLSYSGQSAALALTSNGGFTFSPGLASGTAYAVSINSQPANQSCSVSGASGTVANSNVSNVAVSCAETFSASGMVTVTSNAVVDSDVNDSSTTAVDNSSFSSAQSVDNLATIYGFATRSATGNSGDQFATRPDRDDVFRVTLQKNQQIRLQVVNFDKFSSESEFEGDLDLQLYDNASNLVASSDSITEFEAVQVPADGEYFVVVEAYSGASRYALKLLSPQTSSLPLTNSSVNFVAEEAIVKFSNEPNLAVSARAAMVSDFEFRHQDRQRATLATKSSRASLAVTDDAFIFDRQLKKLNPQAHSKIKTLRQIKQMRLSTGVEWAEPNYIRRATISPNDSLFNLQWHYTAMKLPQAWELSTGTPANGEVIVAVIDTGIFLAHDDFSGQLVSGYDFISSTSNSLDGDGIDANPDDPGDSKTLGNSSWHGTHVAGTVAMKTNNSIGAAGVSWGAKIMPLRVLGEQGGSSYDIMQALRFAAGLSNDSGTLPAKAADVINLSLGGGGASAAEQALFTEIFNQGIIVVAAAGNENSGSPSYPAAYEQVFSVSALDAVQNRAPYSNFGSSIDIAAPGGDSSADKNGDGQPDGVLSAVADDTSGSRKTSYAFYQGTSMAAPHVAGMFALMKAIYPQLTASIADSLLKNGRLSQDLGSSGRDNIYGWGMADALKAAQAARDLAGGAAPPPLPASIVASPTSITLGANTSAALSLGNQGGGVPSLSSIQSGASWLSITASNTDAQGLGSYNLMVDRSGLADGIYTSQATFSFGAGTVAVVPVSMRVGSVNQQGQASQIYILAIAESSGELVSQFDAALPASGQLTFSLSGLPSGNYQIVAGTDVDNDSFLCQHGESCGAYPSLSEAVYIDLSSDKQGLDFTIDVIAGFSGLGSNSNATAEQAQTIRLKKK